MSRGLQSIIDDAIEEFKERIADNQDFYKDGGEPHDDISEIADSSVPVYTADLMELATEDLDLAVTEPELGPAFDGSPTPANIVAANVYEAVQNALWGHWHTCKDEIMAEDEEEEG